jgi:hypothetical protein
MKQGKMIILSDQQSDYYQSNRFQTYCKKTVLFVNERKANPAGLRLLLTLMMLKLRVGVWN